jgi:hypothetical protein
VFFSPYEKGLKSLYTENNEIKGYGSYSMMTSGKGWLEIKY